MDFHLFGGWHVTVLPGTWVLLAVIVTALAVVVLFAKELLAR